MEAQYANETRLLGDRKHPNQARVDWKNPPHQLLQTTPIVWMCGCLMCPTRLCTPYARGWLPTRALSSSALGFGCEMRYS